MLIMHYIIVSCLYICEYILYVYGKQQHRLVSLSLQGINANRTAVEQKR